MENISYSVIIRTTGNAHEKYQKLLDSISDLIPQPEEIIVVLPEGYPLPTERLGSETFYFCSKGMVIQRMTGIEKCHTKYALICDDDVCFSSDFVQKLYEPIMVGKSSLSAGPLYSFLPQKGLRTIFSAITGGAVPTTFHKNRYNSVLRTGGYSYNRHLNPKKSRFYETQSVAWTCFFADLDALKKIDFNDEKWLDAHGYSYLDDQTMFYKAWLRGYKTIVVADAEYIHLDGKTSTTKKNKPAVLFSLNFNRIVFWHRFIYMQQKGLVAKAWSRICFEYRLLWIKVLDKINLLRHRVSEEEYKISCDGLKKGLEYIKSEEYYQLPKV